MTAIYLDMDGVLANFSKRAYEIFPEFHKIRNIFSGMNVTGELSNIRKEFNQRIVDTPDFWYSLEYEKGAVHLLRFLIDNVCVDKISIISSPSTLDHDRCIQQKRRWLKSHVSFVTNDRIFFDNVKTKYIDSVHAEQQILIDDRTKNIDAWIKSGGIGILHDSDNYLDTLEELDRIIH